MDPEHGCEVNPVIFAQLTVASGTIFNGVVSIQGKSVAATGDWTIMHQAFTNAPPPPPPPVVVPPPPPPVPPPPPPGGNPFGPPPPAPAGGPSAVVNAVSTGKSGYTTYQVAVQFGGGVSDVYALFGEAGGPLVIPGGFQVAAPFGADVGPVRVQRRANALPSRLDACHPCARYWSHSI